MRGLVIASAVMKIPCNGIDLQRNTTRDDGDCFLLACASSEVTRAWKLCHLVEAASCDVSGGVTGGVVCSALALWRAADEVNVGGVSVARRSRSFTACAFGLLQRARDRKLETA